MRTRLSSRLSLLFLAFAVAMLVFLPMAFAEVASPDGTTATSSPTIQSDLADYPPGATVTLTGSNWQPGESVNIKVNDTYGASWARNVDVTADASGNVTDSFNLPDWFVSNYDVAATGSQSGTATTTFTDKADTTDTLGASPDEAVRGQSVTYTATYVGSTSAGLPTGKVNFKDTTTGTDLCTNVDLTRDGDTTSVTAKATCTKTIPTTGPLGEHEIQAKWGGNSNYNPSNKSITTRVNPRPPSNLQVTAKTQTSISLSWEASPDAAAINYYRIQYGSSGATVSPEKGATSYTLTGLNAGTQYSIVMTSYYLASNVFYQSGPVSVTATTESADTRAPTVSSINRADANPTNASSVSWDVTFSESVTNVNAADFNLATSITGVSGSGANYTVTARTPGSDGNFSLNLIDDDSIVDGANNKLGGTGAGNGNFSGEIYRIDKTKPGISGSAATQPGGANYTAGTWTNKSVEVTFYCTDGGTGVDTNTVAGATLGASGADQSVTNTGSCTDNAGNVANSAAFSNIDIDKDAPVISDDGRKALADGQNGWYVSEAFNKFSASDALSGLADSSKASFEVGTGSGEGSGLTVASGAVSDNAGNTARKTSAASFDVDLTDPTIRGTLDKSAASTGWFNASTGVPTVDFECSDNAPGSGLATGACPASYTFANGANQVHEGTVTDIAGRSASTTNVNGINVDLDAPNAPVATTDPLNPVANSGDFFKDTVTVSYGGSTDVGPSGIAGYSAAQTFITTDTHSYSGTATDNAGNVSVRTTGQVKVDATLPSVGITGCPTSPVLLNSTQSVTVAASDEANGSGLVSDPSGQVALNTSSVGPQSKTITVEDKVGHSKSATCSYSVKYGFSGFLQPINYTAHQIGTDISTFKAGSTVPVKFKLTDANGNVVQPASAPVWLTPLKGQATSQAVDEPVHTDTPTAGGLYRYDALSQQWIYNWSTKGMAGGFYYRIGVKLDDGQTYYQNISLR